MTSVAGLFDTYDEASRAVEALEQAGFGTEAVTILARKQTLPEDSEERLAGEAGASSTGKGALAGGLFGGLSGLLVGLGSVLIPGVGPVIAGGALATTLAAAAAGAGIGAAAGGFIGYLTGLGIPEREAQLYAEGIKRGGVLVIVEVEGGQEEAARTIFENTNAVNIERAAEEWLNTGWVQFDDSVDPDSSYPRIWGGLSNQR